VRKLAAVAIVLGIIGSEGCRRTDEPGEYEVQRPTVGVETDTIRAPTIGTTQDTLVVPRPEVRR
jgi:hypothetical protein